MCRSDSVNMYSNSELAELYDRKQRLLGNKVIEFIVVDEDNVLLLRVLDKENEGRLEIPSFITGIIGSDPLNKCNYSEIYINNRDDKEFIARGLCSGMESRKLKVKFKNWSNVVDMGYMFNVCKNLEELDLDGIDTSRVRSMRGMFNRCKRLKRIDVSRWDTSQVEDMYEMFSGCESLKELDISKWDTSKVVWMSYIFSECSSLKSIDISNLNTNNIKYMGYMFNECSNLEYIRLGELDLRNVEDMDGIFSYCELLKKLDMRGLKFKGLKSMDYMFNMCSNLEAIEFGDIINISNVREADSIFRKCVKLKELKLSKVIIDKRLRCNSILFDCSELKKIEIKELVDSEGKQVDVSSDVLMYKYKCGGCYKLASVTIGGM